MADIYPKLVLALILVCLVVLLGWGGGAAPGDEAAARETATGRYEFVVFPFRRGRTILIRHDTATGAVWGLRRWGGDDAFWVDMTEVRLPEAEAEEEALPEAAPAPASTPEAEAPPDPEDSRPAAGDEALRGSAE